MPIPANSFGRPTSFPIPQRSLARILTVCRAGDPLAAAYGILRPSILKITRFMSVPAMPTPSPRRPPPTVLWPSIWIPAKCSGACRTPKMTRGFPAVAARKTTQNSPRTARKSWDPISISVLLPFCVRCPTGIESWSRARRAEWSGRMMSIKKAPLCGRRSLSTNWRWA